MVYTIYYPYTTHILPIYGDLGDGLLSFYLHSSWNYLHLDADPMAPHFRSSNPQPPQEPTWITQCQWWARRECRCLRHHVGSKIPYPRIWKEETDRTSINVSTVINFLDVYGQWIVGFSMDASGYPLILDPHGSWQLWCKGTPRIPPFRRRSKVPECGTWHFHHWLKGKSKLETIGFPMKYGDFPMKIMGIFPWRSWGFPVNISRLRPIHWIFHLWWGWSMV